MKTHEINIRDPFILLHKGVYYLYGTRSKTCWGPADGFDCYTSQNLKNWDGPFEIFHRPDDFFADQNYWAPECYEHAGKFYLVTTLGCVDRKKGIYVLCSDDPMGPFVPTYDLPLTPPDWTCIDGSLYWDKNGIPYLLFSHSFEDDPRSAMCAVELTPDLLSAKGEPTTLFYADEAPWATPVPFAKAEFGMDGDVFFTDGPCAFRQDDGSILLLWASWSDCGYGVGAAVSKSGNIYGPWEQLPDKVFPGNGGHGMMFHTIEGEFLYTLHYPNDFGKEHPIFASLIHENGTLVLQRQDEEV